MVCSGTLHLVELVQCGYNGVDFDFEHVLEFVLISLLNTIPFSSVIWKVVVFV